ncbi:hypothetical protein RFI_25241, partial [Reticulomyxa filosa]
RWRWCTNNSYKYFFLSFLKITKYNFVCSCRCGVTKALQGYVIFEKKLENERKLRRWRGKKIENKGEEKENNGREGKKENVVIKRKKKAGRKKKCKKEKVKKEEKKEKKNKNGKKKKIRMERKIKFEILFLIFLFELKN